MAVWIIDSDHSCATFAVLHMMLAHVRGQFYAMKGSIHFDPAGKTGGSVEVEIDVASVTTGNKKRDAHLLSSDFFDQPRYPKITFKSRSIELLDEKRGRIIGDLTLHGVTRPVTFETGYAGPVKSLYGGETTMGFTATLQINREDFGMMWGSEEIEGGGLMASRDILITLDVEADLAE
ncbi:MAG TPA: YceI family protein [Nitrospirota bacterium]